MPVTAAGFITHEQIDREVERVKQKLGPDVVRVKHSIGEDTDGDPAIYFRVVITDESSRRGRLNPVTQPVVDAFVNELHPYSNWGLIPYFRFRNESEYAAFKDPAWG
jgi:hypothetical protein